MLLLLLLLLLLVVLLLVAVVVAVAVACCWWCWCWWCWCCERRQAKKSSTSRVVMLKASSTRFLCTKLKSVLIWMPSLNVTKPKWLTFAWTMSTVTQLWKSFRPSVTLLCILWLFCLRRPPVRLPFLLFFGSIWCRVLQTLCWISELLSSWLKGTKQKTGTGWWGQQMWRKESHLLCRPLWKPWKQLCTDILLSLLVLPVISSIFNRREVRLTSHTSNINVSHGRFVYVLFFLLSLNRFHYAFNSDLVLLSSILASCQGSTTAAAREKLRFCEGYLSIHSDEAGACLCPAFANGGATDPSKFIDLQLFLNAAHGGCFSFSTQLDRQKVLKAKVADPKAPVPEPMGMTLKETNVHVTFLQQELFFTNWWALLAANKPTGLVQRFLFSFGARLNMGKQAWNGFLRDVTQPLLENFFAAVVRRFGPHMTTLLQPVFSTTAEQRAVIVDLEEIGRLFARKDSVHVVLREAMPKAMYWLGTSIMTNHLVEHLWPSALGFDIPEEFPVTVTNRCFAASVHFMLKRYLYGQAVVSVTARGQGWLPRIGFQAWPRWSFASAPTYTP